MYQQKAVHSVERNLLVVAAPGSGKTTVIINRVAYLVKELGVSPVNILVITFTKSAALNMKKRYMNINSDNRIPFFGTFHALFYKILKNYFGEINILDGGEAHRIIQRVLLNYLDDISEENVREILNYISLFKCSRISLEEFNPDTDKNIFIECFNAYEKYKNDKGLLDFDDLQLQCRKLFSDSPNILEGYRKIFKYILVDEFQDCDSLQLELLQLLGAGNSVFAVGDEDQCIYGFRGSRPDCMVDFHKHFKDGKKTFLLYNYRSPENIINTSRELIGNNKMRNAKDIRAARKDSKNIEVRYNVDENLQAEEIALRIEKARAAGEYSYRDNAVLYRTNVESRSLIDAFIRKKIPFRLLDKEYNFFEHFICRDILAYLSLSIDGTDRESFKRIINKPFRYVSKLNIDKVMAHRIKDNCFDILSSLESIPIYQLKVIKSLKKDIHYINKMSLRSAVDFVIMSLSYIDYLKEYSSKFKVNINELEEILEEFKEACSQFSTITQLLIHVDEVKKELKKSEKNNDEDCVILSTIHGVKGMEFTNVFIINCVEDIIPHSNSIEHNLEEERRLFYVGITRTMENLLLFSPKIARGKTKETSRFLIECGFGKEKAINTGFSEGDHVLHESFGKGVIEKMNDDEANIRFDNGIMRRFDILILVNNRLLRKIENN